MASEKPRCSACPECKKTYEECADARTCSRTDISLHVCEVFGTRPLRGQANRSRRKT